MIKKYFITGLALLLPAILTVAIVAFIVKLLTNPFINLVGAVVSHYQTDPNFVFDLYASPFILVLIRLIVLLLVCLFIMFIGFLTQSIFIYSFLKIADNLIHRIPVINKVYKAIQDVIHTLFSSKSSTFKQVVLVPYPNRESMSLGFLTTNILSEVEDPRLKDKIPVFVAGTPNPSFGFIFLYDQQEIIPISMKVDEAFKLLVSCGIMLPGSTNGKI